jgi:hypothetical protein
VNDLPGWFLSDWFGYSATTLAPWLFHAEHGFLYRYPESTNENLFVYDDAMVAWWYTNETVYLFIYAFDPPADNAGTNIPSGWVFYFEGTKGSRVFGAVEGAMPILYFDP